MRILIHACPARLWFVEEFLLPELRRQQLDADVWTDRKGRGNLAACMEAFAACGGDGHTWHLQDDVWPAADFSERVRSLEYDGVVCGFVNEVGGPDCNLVGEVYAPDMWYSFPCIRIPDGIARDCADWYFSKAWKTEAQPEAWILDSEGRGDDWFFREYFELRHGGERVLNLRPCLAEHVDWLVGGSVVSRYRGYRTRAVYWKDEERVEDLQRRIRARKR